MKPMTDPYREWDVAYLLGSLSPAEQKEYERHLGTCAACKSEVAALDGLTSIMSALPRAQAAELLPRGTPSPEAKGPRTRARVWIAVVLVAIAAVLAVSVRRVFGQAGSDDRVHEVSTMDELEMSRTGRAGEP